MKVALKYSKNFQELLQVINDNLTKFNNSFLKEENEYQANKGKNNEKSEFLNIYISMLVNPTKKDNLKEILILIRNIINGIKREIKKLYLVFPPFFFEKYINLYSGNNIDNLFYIQDIINLIKENQKNFEIQIDLNKVIHETGLSLLAKGSLTNIQIIKLIQKDSVYRPGSKYLKDLNCYNIFNGLNISLIEQEFEKECQKINWINIFGEEYLIFVKKIISLIKHMNNFNKLFIILNIKEIQLPKNYTDIFFTLIQNAYKNLFQKTYNKETCPNFIDDSEKLIYYTDLKGNNIEEFLLELNNLLSENLIYEIYLKILAKHKTVSIKTENNIVNFLLKRNSDNNKESYILLYLIERCPKSKSQIFRYFEEFNLNGNEILNYEESENIKLIRGLLNNDMYDKGNKLIANYINHNNLVLNDIKKRIEENTVLYNEIENFFINKKSEKILFNRLLIINLMNNNEAEKQMKSLRENFYKAKEIINNLVTLLEDKNFFFKNSKIDEIKNLNELIEKIKNNTINYYQNNNEINIYLKQNNEINERIYIRRSLIYLAIYNKKKLLLNDENKCLEETNKKLNEFKPFLIGEKINNINKELQEIIKSLKLNKEIINQEVNELIFIFKINDNNYKNKIFNSIFCIYYKENILKIVYSIKNIIEISKAKKDSLYNLLNTIILYLEKNEIVDTVQLSIKLLKVYSIDVLDENDNLIKLFKQLNESNEIFQLLLGILDDNIQEYNKLKNNLKNIIFEDFEKIFKFIKIFEDKNKISQMKDKEFIKKIKEEINKKVEINITKNNSDILLEEIDNLVKIQN